MAERVDVPALLRRLRQDAADSRCREARADMAYLDRLAGAVEALNRLSPRRWRESVAQAAERAEAQRVVLLRGEVAP